MKTRQEIMRKLRKIKSGRITGGTKSDHLNKLIMSTYSDALNWVLEKRP